MNRSTFDTLTAARELQAAGMQDDQAEAVVTAISHAHSDQVTAGDLAATAAGLCADLAATAAGLCADLAATAAGLCADLAATAAGLRADLAATAADLRTDLAATTADLRTDLAATAADLRTDLAATAADFRADLAGFETRIARAMLVQSGVTIAATVGLLSLVITLAGGA